MRCRVLGIMARNSGLNDCSVADTSLVGLSGVHRITCGLAACVLLLPMQILQSSSGTRESRGKDKRCLLGGRSGLRKYLSSEVLD